MNTAELDPVVVRGYCGEGWEKPDRDTLARPFAEGAKARAIVDFCAREGLAAYFLDAGGRVIIANEAASAVESDGLSIEWGELRARGEGANAAFRAALVMAIATRSIKPMTESIEVRDSSDASVFLTCLGYRNASPVQRLKAVVLVSHDRAPRVEKVKALTDLLLRG